jgi:hypothetical protein
VDKLTIGFYCEKCEKDNHSQNVVIPINMPKGDELIKLLEVRFNYKKPFLLKKNQFEKIIHKTYLLFKCPICGWLKMSKLNELILQGFINVEICCDCDLDLCLWNKCEKGGFIKNVN